LKALRRLSRLLFYQETDPIPFWRGRAGQRGWFSVMWLNSAYNELADRDQWEAIRRNLPEGRSSVLDLGCGTGRMTQRLAGVFERYVGVDLEDMVEEARRRNPQLTCEYHPSTILDYEYPPESFDLVLSMACLGNACHADDLPRVAERMVRATKAGGRIILIDAFHELPALTRACRVSPGKVVKLFSDLGMTLEEWDGLHCFPFRLVLARPALSRLPGVVRAGYRAGELVRRIAPRRLSDYSVIALTKR
jgi:SAM-dependent methyltransferase